MTDFFLNDLTQDLIIAPQRIVFNIVLTFVLTIIAAWVYKKTHRSLSFSPSFVFTLILIGPIITAVMMVIGNSIARAFGAFGAFSLIRFRTVVKDTKDMAFVFWVLALGMAVGTDNYVVALSILILVAVFIFVLTKINFGSLQKNNYILSFSLNGDSSQKEVYKSLFDKYLKLYNLLNLKTSAEGRLNYTFEVKSDSKKKINEFISELEKINGLEQVDLLAIKDNVEY